MSYILDALQRAHAERERAQLQAGGSVPGLLSQVTALPASAQALRGRARLALALGGGLGLVGLGVIAGMVWREPATTAVPSRSAVEAAERVLPGRSPAVPNAGLSAPPASSAGAKPKFRLAAAGTKTAQPENAPPVRDGGAAKELPTLAQLPAAQRLAIPPLALSGSVYSTDPASRFLMVKGEVVREGAELAPGWRLEEIRPQEIVLRFQGLRYRQAL
jgi:general secretion pathway protein B